jgi:type I restriction enzyme S subunit
MNKRINIPVGWREAKLGEVCKIKHGKSQKNVECSNGKYPILASGGLIGYANDFLYDKESVLIGRKGTIDKPQYMNTPFWTVDTLFYTEIKDNNFAKWLFYNFSYIKWKKYNEGSTVPSLTGSGISNIKILLPPLQEQKAIADILEKWDEAIESTSKLIEAKKKRFEWFRNEVVKNAKNTNNVKLGDILTESRVNDVKNDPQKRLTVRLHLKGVETREYRGTEIDGATQYFIRRAGQLIYGKQNIFRGSIGMVPNYLDGYSSSQDIPAFDIDKSVNSDWLLYYISRSSFYKKLEHYSTGSGSKRVHPKELFKIYIPLPPLLQQKQIAKTLNTAKKEITILEEILAKYKSQKKGLMQKLLTGKIRVNNINLEIRK